MKERKIERERESQRDRKTDGEEESEGESDNVGECVGVRDHERYNEILVFGKGKKETDRQGGRT